MPLESMSVLLQKFAKRKDLESSTIDLAEIACAYFLRVAGDLRVNRYTRRHTERFQEWVIGHGFSRTTANIYCKSVSSVFGWAVRREKLRRNPFAKVRMFKTIRRKNRIYSPDEIRALLSSCPNKLWQARIMLAVTTGMRAGEVLNLTVDDVDFGTEVIYVQPKKETAHTWRWVPKDKEMRIVPLIPEAMQILVDIMAELPAGQPYLMITPKRYRDIIRLKERGKLPDRVKRRPDENFSKPLKKIRESAGVYGTFHDLRKTCITNWLVDENSRLAPHEVMPLSGHSDVKILVNHYAGHRASTIVRAKDASTNFLTKKEATGSKYKPIAPQDLCIVGATGLEPATS